MGCVNILQREMWQQNTKEMSHTAGVQEIVDAAIDNIGGNGAVLEVLIVAEVVIIA